MSLTLYGTVNSRAFRCMWLLAEAELAYTLVEVDFATDETQTKDYLTLNPNGKVPALRDGDRMLIESLAIKLHVAHHHAPDLWPHTDDSTITMWTVWAMGELEGPHDSANRLNLSIDRARFDRSLNMLRQALNHSAYICGDRFSVVDLNTAAILLRPQYRPIVRDDPNLGEWFAACYRRPALKHLR